MTRSRPRVEPGVDGIESYPMSDIIRIKRIVARPVMAPMKMPLQTSSGAVATAPLVLIDCETEQGVSGHAYIFALTPAALKSLAEMVKAMSDLLIGDELLPFEIERKLTQKFTLLGLAGVQRLAQSGIDIAAWDALARARNCHWRACSVARQSRFRPTTPRGSASCPSTSSVTRL
jgi:mandelate racemase